MRFVSLTILCAIAAYSSPATAWFFGPSNLDECINKYTKDTTSNAAVSIIANACDLKYKRKVDTDYASCILDSVPDVKVDRAAYILAKSCRDKYPLQRNPFADPNFGADLQNHAGTNTP